MDPATAQRRRRHIRNSILLPIFSQRNMDAHARRLARILREEARERRQLCLQQMHPQSDMIAQRLRTRGDHQREPTWRPRPRRNKRTPLPPGSSAVPAVSRLFSLPWELRYRIMRVVIRSDNVPPMLHTWPTWPTGDGYPEGAHYLRLGETN